MHVKNGLLCSRRNGSSSSLCDGGDDVASAHSRLLRPGAARLEMMGVGGFSDDMLLCGVCFLRGLLAAGWDEVKR